MLDSLTRIELQRILLDVLSDTKATAILVTHDVDEALLVADRVVMMTTGPRARIGQVIDVPFGPTRDREQVLVDPCYYPLRGRLIAFLEAEDARREGVEDRSVARAVDASVSHALADEEASSAFETLPGETRFDQDDTADEVAALASR
jgi:ABC-type proline/glycine betaine transport system ATPase subunit